MSDSILMIGHDELDLFVKALHAPVRRRILAMLREQEMNVNEIAKKTGISQSTAVTHVQALEKANLVISRPVRASKGTQKACISRVESAVILFREPDSRDTGNWIVSEMPVGLFFDHEVHPTCGLASEQNFIGFADSPATFLDPHRATAQIIWFEYGFVEYMLPVSGYHIDSFRSVAISAELCSEFPGNRSDWPSDITVWMNGREIGTFRSPGDPGDRRGHLNPSWWTPNRTQYGFLKEWRVTRDGSFIDGVRISDVVLDDLNMQGKTAIQVRFGIKEDAEFRGGLNLIGRRFGNYPQDIRLTIELESLASG